MSCKNLFLGKNQGQTDRSSDTGRIVSGSDANISIFEKTQKSQCYSSLYILLTKTS